MNKKKSIYLDHSATTPTAPEVVKAMEPYFINRYGNASSIHRMGRQAHAAIEDARTIIGNFLGTEAVDIIFTSGGTESNNFAIKGICFKNRDKGNHIITSSIEHMSVLETCRFMESHGFEVTYIGVDEYGLVNPSDVEKAIRDNTVLVSIMHANNEIGTVEPIKEIAGIIKRHNAQRIYFHADAVQSFGKIPVDVEELGIDLLSISAHKVYGPKGIGALYIRKGTQIQPHSHGGHHESNLRAGTEDVSGIVGFAKAVELAKKHFRYNERIKRLRDRLHKGLAEKIREVKLNGHPEKRLPDILNLSFKDIENESLLVNFDIKGIYASAGSACTSGSIEPSHVLKAIGLDNRLAKCSVRFSLGLDNTDSDIDYCLKEIPKIIERLRSVSSTIGKP